MPEKFLNKYRIPSARLQNWDYKNAAAYFITICAHNREHFFGEIKTGKMQLSHIGRIVESEWIKTPAIRPDMNLQLGEFVVMPNHFHAILIIGENGYNTSANRLYANVNENRISAYVNTGALEKVAACVDGVGRADDQGHVHGRDAMHGVSTTSERVPPSVTTAPECVPPPPSAINETIASPTKNKFAPQSKNLASIIRGFKSAVTTQVKKMYGKGGDSYNSQISATITAPFAWQPRFHDHIIRDTESFDRIRYYIANNPMNGKEDKFFE